MVSFTGNRGPARERVIGRIEAVREGLAAFNDFVVAGAEILAGQIGGQREIRGDKAISRQAGELLVELGVANSVDEGILIFHERIGRANPSLRRTLARLDRAMGRVPKVKRSTAQRAYTEAVKGGLVVRDRETRRIKRLTPQGKALLNKAKRGDRQRLEAKRKKRQGTAVKKLRGFGQIKK